ncbi:SDR family oxidoreductase [Amycolatopsis solani]|uniref:SDR family oxidoreductase n=1 Tax=Amycolatopsis solani TaxID=3028615 RepID=UPI00296FC8BA|nr:SDR family oxidoreductase [Amycolatopsis sp. MEP2-6]
MTGLTVVTGAAGYLGRRIVARLLAETGDRLLLTVRGEPAGLETSLRRELGATHQDRITVVPVDLLDPAPFRAVDPSPVTRVVHVAARTEFTVPLPVARAVNVAGTRKVAEFAARCPGLRRLLVLSTLYSAGERTGEVTERAHDGAAGFANHYEWSKYEAERLLTGYAGLPLSVARPATVVADDATGAVSRHNAFHNTLKLYFYGLLSLVPGDPDTRLYLADADFTARGAVRLADPDTPAGIYHLAPSPAETVSLGTLIQDVFDVFETDPGFRRRRVLRPRFCDRDSFRDLVTAARGLSASPLAAALDSVAPFAAQLFLPKRFDNRRLAAAWPSRPPVRVRELAAVACAELVRTRWGRSGVSRMEKIA